MLHIPVMLNTFWQSVCGGHSVLKKGQVKGRGSEIQNVGNSTGNVSYIKNSSMFTGQP